MQEASDVIYENALCSRDDHLNYSLTIICSKATSVILCYGICRWYPVPIEYLIPSTSNLAPKLHSDERQVTSESLSENIGR